jgi:hypothetical protein
MQERGSSRPGLWALGAAVVCLSITVLTPVFGLSLLGPLIGNLTSSPGGHPWIALSASSLQRTSLIMCGTSVGIALVGAALWARKSEPRWAGGAASLVGLLAALLWFVVWDQSFAWIELLRDLGVKEL